MALEWYDDSMKTTIDAAGRLVVPKPLRTTLGLKPGQEVELEECGDGLMMSVVSPGPRVLETPDGPVLVPPEGERPEPLTDETVRSLLEAVRR